MDEIIVKISINNNSEMYFLVNFLNRKLNNCLSPLHDKSLFPRFKHSLTPKKQHQKNSLEIYRICAHCSQLKYARKLQIVTYKIKTTDKIHTLLILVLIDLIDER